jgi:FixJ family two-component response regulator
MGIAGDAMMISVVDDDRLVCKATTSLLDAFGYETAGFASAEDFLKSDALDHTACLISDVNMPGLSGLDLQRELIAQGRRLPIIFVTGSTEERTRARALEAGAFGVLTKPFRPERLIEAIRMALAGGELQAVEA